MRAQKPLLFCLAFVLFTTRTTLAQPSNSSDIVTASGENNCISSLTNGTITSVTDGTQVWKFTIRDGGASAPDADALPTIINKLVITQGVSNTISDWTNIQSVGLFDGNNLLSNGVITSVNITFSSLTINVPDNSSKTLSLRLTLKTALSIPLTIDGKVFRFSIIPSNITVGAGSSGTNSVAAVATTVTGTNAVCVIATKLAFINQPTITGLNNTMTPIIKVGAYDANNNLDLDFTQPVTLTSSGSLVGTSISESAINGIASFSTIKHSSLGTGLVLTVSSTIFSNAMSSSFNIVVSTTFDPGDFAIIGVNTTWTNSPPLPQTNNSRADEISFVVFKDVQPGTTFYMTDNGYGRNTATSFGVTEGLISFTRKGSVLPAGSIFTMRGNGGTAADGGTGSNYDNRSFEVRECGVADTNWIVTVNLLGNNIIGFDLNSTDQVWVMQGGSWTKSGTGAADSSIYSNGTVLYGWSGINWKTTIGISSTPPWTTSGSMLYPRTGCFLNTLGGTSGVDKVKYTGAGLASNFTPTTKLGWIARINNPANWSSYQSTGGINASYDNYNSNLLYQATTTPNTDYGGYKASPVCSFSLLPATESDGNWNGNTSTDWFDCNNWDTKTVPDASINVSIKNTATNNCVVDKNSPSAYLYNNTANCSDLTINNKSLTITNANDTINVNGNFALQNGATLSMANGGTFNLLNGSWINTSSTFISGTGSVVYGSPGIQTIAPENYNNLSSASTGNRILSTTGTIGIKSSFSPHYPNQSYTITNSTIDFDGIKTNQTIPAFVFYNVGFKNGGNKTLTGEDTIINTLTLGNNPSMGDSTILVLNNNNITLHSDNNITANISSIATSGSTPCNINYSGTGRFMTERYLPMLTTYTSRRWRLLTAPVSSINAPTINMAWQEGATNLDKTLPIDPNPGHGTTITYNTTSINGYDQGSTNNPSIYYMAAGSGTWLAPLATNSGKITDKQGYMLFARGDRSIVVSNQYINTTAGTTLRAKGQINTGNVSIALVTGKQIIANPYPSSIGFNGISYNGIIPGTTIGSTYYLWDPKLLGSNNVGGWVTFNSNGNNTYTIVPQSTDTNYMSQYSNKGIIESGSAFMINANSSGSFVVHESDKINSSSIIGLASRPINEPIVESLYSNLIFINSTGDAVLSDGVTTLCNNDYHNEVDSQDVMKLQNFIAKESISIIKNGDLLAIERRKPLTVSDTIYFKTAIAQNNNYKLQFIINNFDPLLQPVLEDKFTKTFTNINATGISIYDFTTTSDTNSISTGRFYITFKSAFPTPLTFLSVNAWQQNNSIAVQWNVANQINIKQYEIEKSTDGIHFYKMASDTAIDNNQASVEYNSIDAMPATGYNYYRIHSIDFNGISTYSKVVKVNMNGTTPSISVYPNPFIGDAVTIQLNNQPKGKYNVEMLNTAGQLILKNTITYPGGTAAQTLPLPNNIASGTYQLNIIKPGNSKIVFTLIK